MNSAATSSANWAGNYRYQAQQVHHPRSLDELQALVVGAERIKAVGSRHSFNDIADSPGDQVSLDAFPTELEIDRKASTVTVSAAARYGDFVQQLHREGYALHNLASLPHISVAGAIATGTHGSGMHNGSLASAVTGIDMVTGTGELKHVQRGDADFNGVVVALGSLGIVTRVTLDIQSAFNVRQDVYDALPWASLYENFDAITGAAYSVSLFTNWGETGIGQVWLKSRVDAGSPESELSGETLFGETLFGARYAHGARHPLPGISPVSTTEQGGVVGPWWNRLAHFKLDFTPSNGDEVQTEYLIPREHALQAMDALRKLAPEMSPHLYIAEIRTVAADDLWLSMAYHHDSVGFHFTWKNEPDAIAAVLPHIDAALAPFDARPHWGKVFQVEPARLQSLYPQLPAFLRLAQQLDPEHKFRNSYLDRTLFSV